MAVISKSKVKFIYLLRNYQGGYPIHVGLQFGVDQRGFNNFFRIPVERFQVFELVNFDPAQCDYYSVIDFGQIGKAEHKSYEQVDNAGLKKYLEDIAKYKAFQYFLYLESSGSTNFAFNEDIYVEIDALYPKIENGKIVDENITEIRLKKQSNLDLELKDIIKIKGTDFDGEYEVIDLIPNKNSVKSILINKKSGLPVTGKKYDKAKLYYTYIGNMGAIKTFQLVPATVMIVPKNDVYIYKHDYIADRPASLRIGGNGRKFVNTLKNSRPKIDSIQNGYDYVENTMKEIMVDNKGDFGAVLKESTHLQDFMIMYSDNGMWYVKGRACYNALRSALDEDDSTGNVNTWFSNDRDHQNNRLLADWIYTNLEDVEDHFKKAKNQIEDWRKKTFIEEGWQKIKSGLLSPLRLIIQITIRTNLFGLGRALYNLKVQKPNEYENKYKLTWYNIGGDRTEFDSWIEENKNRNFDGLKNIFQEYESFNSDKEFENYIRNKIHENEHYLFADGNNELELQIAKAQEIADKLSKITIADLQRAARNSIEVQDMLKFMKKNKNADGDDEYIKLPKFGKAAALIVTEIQPETAPWAIPAGTIIDIYIGFINESKVLKNNPKENQVSSTSNIPNTPNSSSTKDTEIDNEKTIKYVAIAGFIIVSIIVAGILYDNMNKK